MPAFNDLDDFLAIPRVNQLRLASDGTRLVATVAGLSRNRKKFVSALWEIDPRGESAPRRLTWSAAGESSPRFVPDGSVLFLSKRRMDDGEEESDKDLVGLWSLPAAGGEARRIASRPGGFSELAVAADAGIVVLSTPPLPGASSVEDDDRLRKERDDRDVHAILHESSPVRYWDADLGPAEIRLVAGDPTAGDDVELRDLTPQPGRALDEQRFAVAPDGSFLVTGWAEADQTGRPRPCLLLIDLASGDHRVFANEPGIGYAEPAISPDGRSVACIRTIDGDYDDPPRRALWLVDVATGAGHELAAGADLWPTSPVFASDGSAVFFTSDQNGRHPVFRVDVATDALVRVAGDAHYSELCVSRDGSALFALCDRVDLPPVPVRLNPAGGDQQPQPLPAPGRVNVPGRLEEVT